MTQTFFLGQLRLALVAIMAYAGGKGWLTPTDAGLATALITSLGPLVGPWVWSVYANINSKLVPQHAMVIDPITTTANADKPSATVQTAAGTMTGKVLGVLLVAFALSLFLAGIPAMAQPLPKLKTPGQIVRDIEGVGQQAKAVVTGQPAPTPNTALPCTFQMLIKLTPENLLPTINSCIAGKLVSDTQRALQSAQSYGSSGKGDGDAVNCLTPALAIFQAGVEVPAIPAVMAADGTVTTPAVPAQDPGPILLYQKYREFTLSGALTSCQSWFNGPINATIAAGIAGAGTAIAGAALIMPK